MSWNFYDQGFPADLDAWYTAACTKAERAFHAKKVGRSRVDQRRLLMDVRISPDVLAYAFCACDAAGRGLLRVSEVEPCVDAHLRAVALRLCPDAHTHSASSDRFVRDVVERVTASSGWRAYLTKLKRVAERLATADTASTAVASSGSASSTASAPAAADVLTPSFGQQLRQAMTDARVSITWLVNETADANTPIDRRTIERLRADKRSPQMETIRALEAALTKARNGAPFRFVLPPRAGNDASHGLPRKRSPQAAKGPKKPPKASKSR